MVEVQGLAPGRQVRCGFCQRLLEVPYLPRVPVAPWRRRRYGRPKWVPWAWSALAVVAAVILIVGIVRLWTKHHQSTQADSIKRLLESSRLSESSGRLNQALIDLDAALVLARQAEPSSRMPLEELKSRRQDLARRDAQADLDRLLRHEPGLSSLGDWLNLLARCDHDPDLATLQPRIDEQFRSRVRQQADSELAFAHQSLESGRVVVSLQSCNRVAQLLPHLPTPSRQPVQRAAEELVQRLVRTHGVVVEAPQGQFVFGSHSSYVSTMVPVLVKALEAKNYLPYRDHSPWGKFWADALYRLRLEVSEQLEGNYLSTENRLTLIEARLTLTSPGTQIWRTTPRARSTVPLPKLPAYQSSRLAVRRDRSEELERLLYDDARGQIDAKFGYALSQMPACPVP
jgi:hypothetical protein